MKKLGLILLSVSFLFSGLTLNLNAETPQQKRLQNALKYGQQSYFRNVSKEEFMKANMLGGKETVISQTCNRYAVNCFRAMIGGLHNKDVKMRRMVYGSFYSVIYKNEVKSYVNQASGKRYAQQILSQTETDRYAKSSLGYLQGRIASMTGLPDPTLKNMTLEDMIKKYRYRDIARMTPSKFNQMNSSGKSTVISDVLSRGDYSASSAIRTLYQAATYRNGNKTTQSYILSNMINALTTLKYSKGGK